MTMGEPEAFAAPSFTEVGHKISKEWQTSQIYGTCPTSSTASKSDGWSHSSATHTFGWGRSNPGRLRALLPPEQPPRLLAARTACSKNKDQCDLLVGQQLNWKDNILKRESMQFS